MRRTTRTTLGVSAMALLAAASVGAGPALAHGGDEPRGAVKLEADLHELNDSGVSGRAKAVVRGTTIQELRIRAEGLVRNAPHAQHIHYGDDARNECPSLLADDADHDGVLTTLEGVPAYGAVVVSLTTSGSTGFDQVLAVDRYPTAPDGEIRYRRHGIPITAVPGTGYGPEGGTAEQIAASIRDGEGVVVIHGVDHNGNGYYDGEAESDIAPGLPAEATDPAACGVLR